MEALTVHVHHSLKLVSVKTSYMWTSVLAGAALNYQEGVSPEHHDFSWFSSTCRSMNRAFDLHGKGFNFVLFEVCNPEPSEIPSFPSLFTVYSLWTPWSTAATRGLIQVPSPVSQSSEESFIISADTSSGIPGTACVGSNIRLRSYQRSSVHFGSLCPHRLSSCYIGSQCSSPALPISSPTSPLLSSLSLFSSSRFFSSPTVL